MVEIRVDQTPATADSRLRGGLDPRVPQYYFNSYVVALATADITCILERNGTPVCSLNMSFTTAKTLAAALGQAVSDLEAKAGREIMTTQEVEKFIGMPTKEST